MGRLAIDVGGTFTDLVYFDGGSGELRVEKTLTTQGDEASGVETAINLAGVAGAAVAHFIHGGTIAINTILQRKGARTALVTTAGFRDVLEIGRGNRPGLYDFRPGKPPAFVPRHLRFEVRERMDAAGAVITPLCLDDLAAIAAECIAQAVQAVAVVFLHSYAAPAHEAQAAAVLRAALPGVAVTASHELGRQWREYERSNTAVLNAYISPAMAFYIGGLEQRLRRRGFDASFLAMQSNGGTTSFALAASHPITLLESGAAAGINGAVLIGQMCHEPNIIFLDIGGTTAKCAIIAGHQATITTEFRIEASPASAGYPVAVPSVDVIEIGTGGGSIAWFDRSGMLRIGPRSAGADPGPACYDRGGEDATITDAQLIIQVLRPDEFAGGRMTLNVERARAAVGRIAAVLGTGVEQAAVAMLRLGEAAMINALRRVSVQRGHDPRDFVLVAGGGGGPMHAASLGQELGVREVIVPRHPGHISAWGMLVTQPRRDFLQTALQPAEAMTPRTLGAIFAALERQAEAYFDADAQLRGRVTFEHAVDLRYHGQEHWITVRIELARAAIADIVESFHEAHERAYTFQLADTQVEFVNFRLTAIVPLPIPRFLAVEPAGLSVQAAARGERMVYFGEHGRHKARIFRRESIPPDIDIAGPVVIEEPSSTTVVLPHQRVFVDRFGFLHITAAGRGKQGMVRNLELAETGRPMTRGATARASS